MTESRRYTLAQPLALAELVDVARRAVLVGSTQAPERAASAVRAEALRLLPAYGRDLPDAWEPRTREDAGRRGAYDGLIDAWEGSTWRAAKGSRTPDPELYAAGYILAGAAVKNERLRAPKGGN